MMMRTRGSQNWPNPNSRTAVQWGVDPQRRRRLSADTSWLRSASSGGADTSHKPSKFWSNRQPQRPREIMLGKPGSQQWARAGFGHRHRCGEHLSPGEESRQPISPHRTAEYKPHPVGGRPTSWHGKDIPGPIQNEAAISILQSGPPGFTGPPPVGLDLFSARRNHRPVQRTH